MAQAQQYDPTNPTPYQPVELPQPQQSLPSPLPTQMPEANGAVKHSGAVATIADGILRGFMQGRAYGQARQVMQLKSKVDNLQNSYNQDAQLLHQMTVAGVDQNSPEYKQAVSSVQGSWGALMDFYGQHLEQQPSGKKKNKVQQAGSDLLSKLHSQDPLEQSSAWYQVAKKAGPPIFGQIATLNTPQAQAQRKAQQQAAQATQIEAGNMLTQQTAQQTYDKYAGLAPEQVEKLDPEERQKFANSKAILFPAKGGVTHLYENRDGTKGWYVPGDEPEGASAVQTGGTAKLYKSADGKHQEWYLPGTEPEGWEAQASGAASKPVRAWTKGKDGKITSVLVDPATNQMVPGSENPDIQPPASMTGRVTTGVYHWKDDDGNIHETEETHISSPVGQGGGGGKGSDSAPAAPSVPRGTGWIGSPKAKPLYVLGGTAAKVQGLQQPGNVNIMYRPSIPNPEAGGDSSVWSTSFGTDKGEVLVPRVTAGEDGQPPHTLSEKEAQDYYQKYGKFLGIFDTPEHATAYANKLHEQQAKLGKMQRSGNSSGPPPTPAAPPAARASSPAPTGAGKDRIIGHAPTTAQAAAQKDYDTAVKIAGYADRVHDDNPAEQRDFAIALSRAMSGRFQEKQMDQEIKHAGIAENFQQWLEDNKTGKLTPTILGRLKQIAHDYRDSTYEEWQASKAGTGAADAHSGGTFNWDAHPTVHP